MFEAEHDAHFALQQYKADLKRSKMQLRRQSTAWTGSTVSNNQERGRSTKQDSGSIARARRGSNGDIARGRKIERRQSSVPRPPQELITWSFDKVLNDSGGRESSHNKSHAVLDGFPRVYDTSEIPRIRFAELDGASVRPTAAQSWPSPVSLRTAGNEEARMLARDGLLLADNKRCLDLQCQFTMLPLRVMANLLKYVDHYTYLSLRQTCSSWNKAVDSCKPPRYPAAYNLRKSGSTEIPSASG